MSKISQILKLIALLETNYLISGRELAERLETNPRNIKSYIEDIRNAGIDVRGISGCRGGYFLASSSYLTPPNLEPEEYSALLLAEKVLTQKNGFVLENELKTAIAKIRWAAGDTVTSIEPEVPEDFVFSYGKSDNCFETKDIFEFIQHSIVNRKCLHITYYSPVNDTVTKRVIHPYGIIYREGSWYVVAYCRLRQAIRTFKMVRIRRIDLLNETYRYPPDFSIRDYMRNSFGIFQGKTFKIEIRFFHPASVFVSEKVWIANQKIMNLKDGSIIFKARVNGLIEIKNWIMSYGHLALVREPKELADLVYSEAKQIIKGYEKEKRAGDQNTY
ncbi:MAG: helix-turn-helix transcriptional regulator [Caldicoprobacterales bacterium]